jgi:gliding motility-associated-like protein
MVNGNPEGNNIPEFNSNRLLDNDRVICRVTVNEGCVSVAESNSITVHAYDIPVVVCMNDTTIAEGASIKLYGNVSGNYSSVLWTPAANIQNNTSINQALISPNITGVYRLTAFTQQGCSAYDEVMITVNPKGIIPTAFSPNNDGINDFWRLPFEMDCSSCFVNIFDRYGTMVYSTKKYSKPWDGTRNNRPLPAGVYYYSIRKSNQEPSVSGSVTIIR